MSDFPRPTAPMQPRALRPADRSRAASVGHIEAEDRWRPLPHVVAAENMVAPPPGRGRRFAGGEDQDATRARTFVAVARANIAFLGPIRQYQRCGLSFVARHRRWCLDLGLSGPNP